MSLNGTSAMSAFAIYKNRKTKQIANNKTQPAKKTAKKLKIHDGDSDKVVSNGKMDDRTSSKKTNKLKSSNNHKKHTVSLKEAEKAKKSEKQKIKLLKKTLKQKTGVEMNNDHGEPKQKKRPKLNDDSDKDVLPQLIPIYESESTEQNDLESNLRQLLDVDPITKSLKVFKWMIAPMKPAQFFEKYWENRVLYIERNEVNYYKDILSTKRLDNIFREFPLYYTKNVDVVSYEDGVKQLHNEEGKVSAPALYDYYMNGCSIRILNPQTYDQKVHLLISSLQEYFGSMVGTNVYLTPPGSQGFAPHYDDIEAFILQLEGRKHWKLYKPVGEHVLARNSSPNLAREDIGEPFMEVTLNAGDMLYFPRGTIHEGRTDDDAHSLHITVSVYQHNSYADLLESILPEAISEAARNEISFRKGLPMNYLKNFGFVNADKDTDDRQIMRKQIKDLIHLLPNYVDIDRAVDKLGRKFMYDSMPPVLSKEEAVCSSKYDGDILKDGKVLNRVEIEMDTEIRLLRYHCIRVVVEDEAKIFYNTDNAKVYHGEEEQFLTIDLDLLPCIKELQNSFPKFIAVESLPGDDCIKNAQLVSDLWEKGLLVTRGPLHQVSDGEDDDDEITSD